MTIEEQVEKLNMTARRICKEFLARNIKFEIVDQQWGLVRYWNSKNEDHLIRSSLSDLTPSTALLVADQKPLSYSIAKELEILVPESYTFDITSDQKGLRAMAREMLTRHKSVVIKPADAAHGWGVSTRLMSMDAVEREISYAEQHSDMIIVQEMLEGDDFRIIVINGVYVSAIKRIPAEVVGDGEHTIRELIDLENSTNPNRGEGFSAQLQQISMPAAENYLGDSINNFVPFKGEQVRVVGSSNMSLGGSMQNIIDQVPEQVKTDSCRIAQELNMVCCAVDYIVDDSGRAVLIEINASPALYEHDDPFWGTSSGAITKFVDAIL
jgi:D-alanine-D-alanine ligase-like ATP-grasp enzyme